MGWECVWGGRWCQPRSEAGTGGWGQRCDSTGRARKCCPAGLTSLGCKRAARALPGQGRPGGDGKGGWPGAGEPGLRAGSRRGAAARRAAAANRDGTVVLRPPAASGAPLNRPRRPCARAEMCLRLGEPRGDSPGGPNPPNSSRGEALRWEPGTSGSRLPFLQVTFRLGFSFPSSEMEGKPLLESSRCGVAPPPLSPTLLSCGGGTPGREERHWREQPSSRPEGRAEEGSRTQRVLSQTA